MKRKTKYFLLLAGLYFISRLVLLTNVPIFNDEAIYLDWGSRMVAGTVTPFYPLFDGKTPLLMWIFGYFEKAISDPLIAGRLVSVLAGFFALLGIYKLVSELKNTRVALFAMAFYIAVPLFAFYDRQALMESAVGAVGIWAFYYLVRYLKNYSLKEIILLAAVTSLGFYIKPSALLFLLPTGAILILEFVKNPKDRAKTVNALVVLCGITLLACVWVFLQKGAIVSGAGRYISFSSSIGRLWGNLLRTLEILFWQVGPAVFVAIAAGKYLFARRDKVILIWLGMTIFTAIVISNSIQVRYLVPFLPLLVIPAAEFSAKFTKLGLTVLGLTLVSTAILLVNPYLYLNTLSKVTKTSEYEPYYTAPFSGVPINEVVDFIKERSKDSPVVVGVRVDAGNPESTMFAYFGQGRYNNVAVTYFDSRILTVPQGVDKINLPYQFYFISRGDNLAGMNAYLTEVKRIYNKGDNFMGVYELTK